MQLTEWTIATLTVEDIPASFYFSKGGSLTSEELALLGPNWSVVTIYLPCVVDSVTYRTADEYLKHLMSTKLAIGDEAFLLRYRDVMDSENLRSGEFKGIVEMLPVFRVAITPEAQFNETNYLPPRYLTLGFRESQLGMVVFVRSKYLEDEEREYLGKTWSLISLHCTIMEHDSPRNPVRYTNDLIDYLSRHTRLTLARHEPETSLSMKRPLEDHAVSLKRRLVTIGFRPINAGVKEYVWFTENRLLLSEEMVQLSGEWSIINIEVPTIINGVSCWTGEEVVTQLPFEFLGNRVALEQAMAD